MRGNRLSSALSSIEPLEYLDVALDGRAMEAAICETAAVEPESSVGVPEEEVARRVRCAREQAVAEVEDRLRLETEQLQRATQETLAQRLRQFDAERASYFRSVEGELIQLAFAIARKIVQREAELDPTLLSGLVRIALDRMQTASAVRVRVAPIDADRWRGWGRSDIGDTRWNVVADETLDQGDCVVETELGTADFSFEAQLREVEESFTRLLAYRPAA